MTAIFTKKYGAVYPQAYGVAADVTWGTEISCQG